MALKVTMVFPYLTGLPEDTAQNTFYFETSGSEPSAGEITTAIGSVLRFFIVGVGANQPIGEWLSGYINPDTAYVRAVGFNPATGAETGEAIISDENDLVVGTGTGLPLEVALCLSYRAAFSTPVQQRRRRGRVYIGPLDLTALDSAFTDGPRPDPEMVTGFAAAAERLISDSTAGVGSGGTPAPWSVWSRADGELVEIVGGWVDDEFDTQRRRGLRPTSRTTYGIA